MSTSARAGAFAVGLALIFGAAFGVGRLVGDDGHGAFRMRLLTTQAQLEKGGDRTPLRFQVLTPAGSVQKRFAVAHEKELHLVVVSHGLGSYQHLHPVMAADGTWSVDAAMSRGEYRIFADFQPSGGSNHVVHRDVLVGGRGIYGELVEDGEQRTSRTADGMQGEVTGDLVAGGASEVTFTLRTSENAPVRDLEPYLGAYGHLVVISDEGLDYVHAHAEPGAPGPTLTFHVETPKAGQYHLFLDVKRGGQVRTLTTVLVAGKSGDTGDTEDMGDMGGMDHGDH